MDLQVGDWVQTETGLRGRHTAPQPPNRLRRDSITGRRRDTSVSFERA